MHTHYLCYSATSYSEVVIKIQGAVFSLGKTRGGVAPEPYHRDLPVLLLVDWNAFTLELLQDFLQRFNLQHTAPEPEVAALAVSPAQVLTFSPSYKEPGTHAYSVGWDARGKKGCSGAGAEWALS